MTQKPLPKALFFDVFGSLTDWRTSIAREAERILGTHRKVDWIAFADAWRVAERPAGRTPSRGAGRIAGRSHARSG